MSGPRSLLGEMGMPGTPPQKVNPLEGTPPEDIPPGADI